MKKILLASALATMMGGAFAQVYVGGAFGLSQVEFECDSSITCDKSDTGFKVYGGYQFNPLVAVELGYIDFGKMSYDSNYGLGTGKVEASALTLAAALRGNLTPALTGVARLGFANVKSSDSWSGLGGSGSESETSAKAYFGLGLEYAFNKQVRGTLGADFSQGEIYGATANLRAFTIGVQYGF